MKIAANRDHQFAERALIALATPAIIAGAALAWLTIRSVTGRIQKNANQ